MFIKAAFCQDLIEKELQEFKEIPFSLFWDNRPTDQDLKINPTNLYGHSEPEEYFQNASWIGQNWDKFDSVLTLHPVILNAPNAIKTLFGSSAFHDHMGYMGHDLAAKEFKVTFIRGMKKFYVKGHELRWKLWDRKDEITLNHEFYETTTPPYASNSHEEIQWFTQRSQIFGSPMFHIAIENTSTPNYFTEKIIDCFLFSTIPIYYGCPNIGEYFHSDGILTFNDIDELIYLCNTLTPQDYLDRRYAIDHNFNECKKYLNMGKTIRNSVHKALTLKGII